MNRHVITQNDRWAIKPADVINLVAGVPIEVLKVKPEKKMALMLPEDTYIFMKLRDSAGEELDPNTKIVLAGKTPAHDIPVQLSSAHLYKPWKDIELSQQKNSKYIENFRIDFLEDSELFFEEQEELVIVLIPAANGTLDWSKSDIEIPAWEMTMQELIDIVGEAGIDFAYDIPDEYYEEGYEEYPQEEEYM